MNRVRKLINKVVWTFSRSRSSCFVGDQGFKVIMSVSVCKWLLTCAAHKRLAELLTIQHILNRFSFTEQALIATLFILFCWTTSGYRQEFHTGVISVLKYIGNRSKVVLIVNSWLRRSILRSCKYSCLLRSRVTDSKCRVIYSKSVKSRSNWSIQS